MESREESPDRSSVADGPPRLDLGDPQGYVNREMSLLAFHERVLDEARDETNPLLERLKFVGIVGSILSEFFMVRVAGLRQQIEAGVADTEPSSDALTTAEVLNAVRERGYTIMREARRALEALLPLLEQAGIHILGYGQLDARQRAAADKYFAETVFPVLTPLAFDPGRPFPHISNLSLNLAVMLRSPEVDDLFARVKVPSVLPRLVPLVPPEGVPETDASGRRHFWFLWLEQLVASNLQSLFPGLQILRVHPFRVTRDAEMAIQELEADDLLEMVEEGVRRRRFGSVVRVTIEEGTPDQVREILQQNLGVGAQEVCAVQAPLGTSSLWAFQEVDRPDLKYKPFAPAVPSSLQGVRGSDIFTVIGQHDILLHHPYDSFEPVLELVRAAANDPDVLAIKQTLYRVGGNAPIVEALLDAAANDKQVAVMLELKARFDEESNIGWARALEKEGAHVVYGLVGLKTHSKALLIVRREGGRIRRYVHLGTGNYNAVTTRQYTDLGLLTCREDFGADASVLFNYLTGYSSAEDYRKLLVAPINLRRRFEELVCREIEHQQRGEPGHLIFKCNSLVDRRMIRLLYEASRAGVKVDLLVRGICCLRPGLEGLSENIRVVSIVGRFLEHSRIFYFRNAGKEEVYLGSADLMPRNLDRRVETLFPVEDPGLVRRLRDEILGTYLADNAKCRRMAADGSYERPRREPGQETVNSQEVLIARAASAAEPPAQPPQASRKGRARRGQRKG